MKLVYPAIFHMDEKSGTCAVEVPDLPGCATGGDTLAEAIFMGVDAASGWVLTELEDGRRQIVLNKAQLFPMRLYIMHTGYENT